MKWVCLLLFCFFVETIQAKNICSVTINSSEEIELFKKELRGVPDTQFIELVPPSSATYQSNWFTKVCQSGVQCDVLIISGHFGGTFFGQSGYRLESDTMESLSCSNTCDGIFKRPKEVYLFGCNTLSTKGPDERTPEQYLQVLLSHGFNREMAERITVLRYTPLGDSNKGRMERVFSGVKNIYGFYSIAPTGSNITDILGTYLLRLGNYSDILNDFQGNNTSIGPSLWVDKSLEINSSVTSGLKGEILHGQVCELLSPQTSKLEKLKRINELLNSDERLTHMINIEKVIREVGIKANSTEEEKLLKSIKNNIVAKKELLMAMQYVDFSFDITYRLIQLGAELSWLSAKEKQTQIELGILGLLKRKNLRISDKDLICSLDLKMSQLSLGQINLEGLYSNSYYVSTLDCLNAKSLPILEELSRVILKGERKAAFEAVIILGRKNVFNDEIKKNLIWALKRPGMEAVTYPIGKFIQLSDKEWMNELLTYLENNEVGPGIAYVLAKLKPQSQEIQLKLVQALKIEALGNSASYALRECRPKSKQVKRAIKSLAEQGNRFARELVKNLGI